MGKVHLLTLGEASKQTGKAKTTLANAIANGRLSAGKRKNAKGQYEYEIEPSELFRVFPPLSRKEDKTPIMTEEMKRLVELETRLSMMDRVIEGKDRQLDQLKEECLRWDRHATVLLEDKRSVEEKAREREEQQKAAFEKEVSAMKAAMQAELKAAQDKAQAQQQLLTRIQQSRIGRWVINRARTVPK